MPISKETATRAADESDVAIVVLGRIAGEGRDLEVQKGSYLLADAEEQMLREV